ncbi:MAG: peptidoglycan DD-metalloendopeptidase family protein [Deltaproteobacteria bacterium]|nr:peptidoglycan DD-metalloendopeptidase family protein [Deltaproteobacteria bacterium]
MVLIVAAGCSAAIHEPKVLGSGIVHEVRPGENLYRIGKAYGISHRELARVNNLADPDRVEVGQRLFIPGGKQVLPVNLITPKRAVVDVPELRDFPHGEGGFIWPLASGTLTSSFGPRGQSFHDGIDIGAPPGTPVYAAREGHVIYSDTLRGYGNVVIVEHGGGYATVYAHNEENLVHAGDRVHQGDMVARLGRTGRTSGPNLHFEVRKDNIARNPIFFLPGQTAARQSAQRAKDDAT